VAGGQEAAGLRAEGSCVSVCACLCVLEGRGRERGAEPGEKPSREKAAIVKAGPAVLEEGGWGSVSPLFSGCRGKEEESRPGWGCRGERREEMELAAGPRWSTCTHPVSRQRLTEHLVWGGDTGGS
jgi:hypothetical protein